MHTATHLSEQQIAALPVLRVPLTRPFVWLSQGWAALIVTLVSFGFLTFLVGRIVVFPILGHATWHAYQDLLQ